MASLAPMPRLTTGAVPTLDLARVLAERVRRGERELRAVTPARSDRRLVELYGATFDEMAEASHRKFAEDAPTRRGDDVERHLDRPNSAYTGRQREQLRGSASLGQTLPPPKYAPSASSSSSGAESALFQQLAPWAPLAVLEEQPGQAGAARPRTAEARAAGAAARRAALESRMRKTRVLLHGPNASVSAAAAGSATAAETAALRAAAQARARAKSATRLQLRDWIYLVADNEAENGGYLGLPPGSGPDAGASPSSGVGGGPEGILVVSVGSLDGANELVGPTASRSGRGGGGSSPQRGSGVEDGGGGRGGTGRGEPVVLRHQVYPGRVYPGFADFSPLAHSFRDRMPEREVGPSPHISTTLRADPTRAFNRPGELDVAHTALVEAENVARRRADHPFLKKHSRVIAPRGKFADPHDSATDMMPMSGERARRQAALHRPYHVHPVRVDALRTDRPWASWVLPVLRDLDAPGANANGADFASSSHWREPADTKPHPARARGAQPSVTAAGHSQERGASSPIATLRPSAVHSHSPGQMPLMSPLRGGRGESRSNATHRTQEAHAARIRATRGPDPAYVLPQGAGHTSGAYNVDVREFARTGLDPLGLAARARDPNLKQSLQLTRRALDASTHFYAAPISTTEFAHSPFRDGSGWKRALLDSAGLDSVAERARAAASPTGLGPGLASLHAPIGSLGDALQSKDEVAARARALHLAGAGSARPFVTHPLHGGGWGTSTAGLPGMLNAR